MQERAGSWRFRGFVAVVALGTLASLLLSVASLLVAIQAKNQALPALAYDFPSTLAVHAKQCMDAAQDNTLFTQFDVEYVITVTNSGGRSTNLLHAALTTGQGGSIPWPVALTDGPTALGTIIDGGQATFVLAPAPIASGLSKRIVVNGRIRLNAADASQQSTAAAISSGSHLQLVLVFSDGTKRTDSVPYTLHNDAASSQPDACVNTGDFHYQVDQI